MAWQLEFSPDVEKDLRRIDAKARERILTFLSERIETGLDPRSWAQPLSGRLSGRWRFRIGDYRAICRIDGEKLVVLILEIGHRGAIYRK